jgi:hypothetical protein
MKCNTCEREVVRIRVHSNSKSARFIGECGRQWRGLKCPDCKYNPVELPVLSERKCRGCSLHLPLDKYFYHETCSPVSDFNEDFLYYA